MPNARGEMTTGDVRLMRALRPTHTSRQIAERIGCSPWTVERHAPRYADMCARAERYRDFVQRAGAYVPTFGEPIPF